MTNQQILTKAIEKAIANGWDISTANNFYTESQMGAKDFRVEVDNTDRGLAMMWSYDLIVQCSWTYRENKRITSHITESSYRHMNYDPLQLIFRHDFAKALWGDKPPKYTVVYEWAELDGLRKLKQAISTWEFHLQQMVIADDPIEYLGENIG